MARYVALLRSVNIGGHGRIAMRDLTRSFDALGYTDVTTYIQTGNVLFSTAAKKADKVVADIEHQLAVDFGSSPAVILRTVEDFKRVGAASPYAKAGTDPARHHVTFLATAPTKDRLTRFALPAGIGRDELQIDGLEVYVHTPDGYGNTKLNGSYLERHLAVVSTTRNWNTVSKLCDLIAG